MLEGDAHLLVGGGEEVVRARRVVGVVAIITVSRIPRPSWQDFRVRQLMDNSKNQDRGVPRAKVKDLNSVQG